jgi:hypothetical protein
LQEFVTDVRTMAREQVHDRARQFPPWKIVSPQGEEPLNISAQPKYFIQKWQLQRDITDYKAVFGKRIRELVLNGETIMVPTVGLGHVIAFEIKKGAPEPTVLIQEGSIDDVFRAFEFRILFLLHQYADRFGVCPRCTKIFLRERTTRVHCSNTCASADRMREWRKQQRSKQKGGK